MQPYLGNPGPRLLELRSSSFTSDEIRRSCSSCDYQDVRRRNYRGALLPNIPRVCANRLRQRLTVWFPIYSDRAIQSLSSSAEYGRGGCQAKIRYATKPWFRQAAGGAPEIR